MNISILVIGESGTGKSASLVNLDPNTTFVINVLNKPLPFRHFSKNYSKLTADGSEGNYYASDNSGMILRAIDVINKKRPEIKTIIIDDFQYVMGNAFVNRCMEKGFDKFSQIQQQAWSILNALNSLREDLRCFVLSHSEITPEGKSKIKTIGKMLDEKITLEGMFTIVLHSLIIDEQYVFLTNNDGSHLAKSPLGMFEQKLIPNDLQSVIEIIQEYYSEVPNEIYQKPTKVQSTIHENALPKAREDQLYQINALIADLGKTEDYVKEILAKAKVSKIEDLSEIIADKWLKALNDQSWQDLPEPKKEENK